MKIFILLLSILATHQAHALGLSFGTYVPTASRYQNEPDGARDTFQLNPYVALNHYFRLFNNHYATPEIGFAFHTGSEDEYSKRTTFILWHMAWHFDSRFLLRYGLGTFWTRISGDGEKVELPNGTSTAVFYAPSEAATSYNTTLDVGIEYIINSTWGARADFFIVQPFASEQRALSYTLSMVFSP